MSIEVKTTERGWGWHFICAARCMFRRNTLVEGVSQSFVVSTVGNFMNGRDKLPDTIGFQRYYETMIFLAKENGPYMDADVSNQITLGDDIKWAVDNVDEGSDNVANDMHESNVAALCERLQDGWKYRPLGDE